MSAQNGQHGQVVIDGLYDMLYTPDSGFLGMDSFQCTDLFCRCKLVH